MSERLRWSNLKRAMKVKCRLTARAEIRRHSLAAAHPRATPSAGLHLCTAEAWT